MKRLLHVKHAAIPAVVVLSFGVAACGSSSKAASSSGTSPSTSTNAPAAAGSGTTGGRGPAASGKVASLSGSSLEVQSQTSGQETVSWTSSTTFEDSKKATVSALTTGACVTVSGTTSSGVIKARTVSITQPSSSGTCAATGAAGGFGGAGHFGGGGGAPSFPGGGSAPSGSADGGSAPRGSAPSGSAPRGSRPNFADIGIATGKVVSVSGDTLSISGHSFTGSSFRRGPASGSTSSTTVPATTTVKVTLGSATTYTERSVGSASDLAVGECVTAEGSTDSTGAVEAKTMSITPAVDGACTSGFGRFGQGGAAGGPSGSSAGASA